MVAATFADMSADRGEQERIWASVLKEVIKRRNPGFSENYYGFRSFGNLLEEAANRGLIGFGRDEKSGAYVTRALPRVASIETLPLVAEVITQSAAVDSQNEAKSEIPAEEKAAPLAAPRRRGGRRTRQDSERKLVVAEVITQPAAVDSGNEAKSEIPAEEKAAPLAAPRRRGGRRTRQDSERQPVVAADNLPSEPEFVVAQAPSLPAAVASPSSVEEAPAAKPRRRSPRRPRNDTESATPLVETSALVAVAEPLAPAIVAAPKKRAPRSRKPKAVSE